MSTGLKNSHVFINCPFDAGYRPILNAILFAVFDLGFVALEEEDTGEFRLSRIERIIEECRYGINDLSPSHWTQPQVCRDATGYRQHREVKGSLAAARLSSDTGVFSRNFQQYVPKKDWKPAQVFQGTTAGVAA